MERGCASCTGTSGLSPERFSSIDDILAENRVIEPSDRRHEELSHHSVTRAFSPPTRRHARPAMDNTRGRRERSLKTKSRTYTLRTKRGFVMMLTAATPASSFLVLHP